MSGIEQVPPPVPPDENYETGTIAVAEDPRAWDENLKALDLEGIRAYTQESLEKEVSRQIEREISAQDRQREIQTLKKELREYDSQIVRHKDSLKRVERRLDEITTSKVFINSRKCQSLLDEQEKLNVQLVEAKVNREEILKGLEKYEQYQENDHSHPLDPISTDNANDEETENQRNIRMGNSTAFGSVLKSELKRDSLDPYLDHLQREQPQSTQDQKLSSDNDKSAKRSRKRQRSKDYSPESDDSDWDYSDPEEGPSNPFEKHNGRIVDDGDKDNYVHRVEYWHSNRSEKEVEEGSQFEELDGGLRVPETIWKKIYHYQKVAVQWLWELHMQKAGGILADEMGLGKTVQIVAFVASLCMTKSRRVTEKKCGPNFLVVCPSTVMQQWVGEFHTWWPPLRVAILHECGSFQGSRRSLIDMFSSCQGVLVTSYYGLVQNKSDLIRQNFDYIILDEGHKIRNPDAQITLAVKEFPTSHRIILSGSPLQNNLKELWSLFDFIFPGKLGTLPIFMETFAIPITLGGYANASRTQIATSFKFATILRDTINPYLLRRMKCDVKQHLNLPEKNEQVLFCRLTDHQRNMYRQYICSKEVKQILGGRFKIFVGLIILRKICNHPDLFDGGPNRVSVASENSKSLFDESASSDFGYWKRSGKMIVVESLLKLWKEQQHKVLLFTQSRQMLKILEKFLKQKGYTYAKLDGTTATGSRQNIIDKFNRTGETFVFLLTTRVGGLGVNLTGANRVIIFDPDWNPSTDIQSRERAWRIGQSRDVTIYRLLTSGTIEEKIYHRQIFKQLLINKVLKDPAMQRRFFNSTDLHDLFSFNDGSDKTESSAIFAGTNSEIHVKKRGKPQRDFETYSKTCVETFKVEKAKTTQGRSMSNVMKDFKPSEEESNLNSEERQRLLEKVRKINLKFSKSIKPDEKDRKESKRRDRGYKLEGQRVSHLVKSKIYSAPHSEKNQETDQQQQDDYVLSKLFKKTGVHSALQHDAIVENDKADYMLVEAEADWVAKEAVEQLRQSRRQCFPAEAGVPTWTGTNGSKRPRFGIVSKKSGGENSSSATTAASELLEILRKRKAGAITINNDNAEPPPDYRGKNWQVSLLDEIRNFISNEAQSGGECEATTDELLKRFKKKLPPEQNPLFKALLTEICSFRRNRKTNVGIWKLKEEFQ